jgi:hypothetical protein
VEQGAARTAGQPLVQPGGEPVDLLGAVREQGAQHLEGGRDGRAESGIGQVGTRLRGMEAGDRGAGGAGRGEGEGARPVRAVQGGIGEIAAAPALAAQRARIPGGVQREGGHLERAPLLREMQQAVQGTTRDPQHLRGGGILEHRVAGGVVGQDAQVLPLGLSAAAHPAQGPVHRPADPRIGLETSAEQRGGALRHGMLVHARTAAGGAAQHAFALVPGGDQEGPAGIGEERGVRRRARRPTRRSCLTGAVAEMADQQARAGLDPGAARAAPLAQQGGERLGHEEPARAGKRRVRCEQRRLLAEQQGGRGERRVRRESGDRCGDAGGSGGGHRASSGTGRVRWASIQRA